MCKIRSWTCPCPVFHFQLLTMGEDSHYCQYVLLVQGNAIANILRKFRSPFPSKYIYTVIMLIWARCGRFLLSLSLSLFFPRVAKQRYIQSWIPIFYSIFHRVYVKPIHGNLLHNKLTHIQLSTLFTDYRSAISAYQLLQGRLIYT